MSTTISRIKVKNMCSPRSGTAVANQFVINTEGGQFFQSYESIIAFKPWPSDKEAKVTLDESTWNYSLTTAKYRNIFLGESTKQTQAKIASGEYQLSSLN